MCRINKSEDSRVTHRLLGWIFQGMLTTPTLFTCSGISTSLLKCLCFLFVCFASLKDYSTASGAPLLTGTELEVPRSLSFPSRLWHGFVTKDCTGIWKLSSLLLRWHKWRDVIHTVHVGIRLRLDLLLKSHGCLASSFSIVIFPFFPLSIFSWEPFLTVRLHMNIHSSPAEPDPRQGLCWPCILLRQIILGMGQILEEEQ